MAVTESPARSASTRSSAAVWNCAAFQVAEPSKPRSRRITAQSKLAHQVEDQPLLNPLREGAQRRRAPSGVRLRPDRGRSIRPTHASARVICVTAASISSRVVPRPRLNRIAPMPISGATPMAFKTGESVISPA